MNQIRSDSITISPTALFQIIKVIKKDGPAESGRLYGMPPSTEGNPIEVTTACPEIGGDPNTFIANHNKLIQQLNYDTIEVGFYTRNHYGRSLSFKDLLNLYRYQRQFPDYFALVVVVDEAALFLSIRAFRISEKSLNSIIKHDNQLAPEYISDEMTPECLLTELKVSFTLSPLDRVILKQLLSKFSLLSDIFSLSNFSNMGNQLTAITDSSERISEQIVYQNQNISAIEENRKKRQEYLEVLRNENKVRKQRNLPEHDETEVDIVYPKVPITDKIDALSELYYFKAKTDELRSDLEDENTKINALISLPNKV